MKTKQVNPNNPNNQYTVDRSNPEGLRVLILPEADVYRLKNLISAEINMQTGLVGYAKDVLQSVTPDTVRSKLIKNQIKQNKQLIKNLAKLQHAMKHEVCHASVLRDILSGE